MDNNTRTRTSEQAVPLSPDTRVTSTPEADLSKLPPKVRYFATMGFSVIQLGMPDAKDLTKHKRPRQAWTDEQVTAPTVETLLERFGGKGDDGCNLGLPMGPVTYAVCDGEAALFVLDADTPEGIEFVEANFPPTPLQTKTPSGGRHFFFALRLDDAWDALHNTKIKTSNPNVKIDIRARGAQVAAPLNLAPGARRYEFAGNLDKNGRWAFDAQPPLLSFAEHLQRHLVADASRPARTFDTTPSPWTGSIPNEQRIEQARRYLAVIPPAIQGDEGDNHTYRAACKLLLGFALSEEDTFALLSPWNATCQPSWSDSELRQKIRSAGKSGKEPIGGRLREPRTVAASSRSSLSVAYSRESVARNFDPDRDGGGRNDGADSINAFGPPLTDTGNSEYLAAMHAADVRYDHREAKWFIWGGHRWGADEKEEIVNYATAAIRARAVAVARVSDLETQAAWGVPKGKALGYLTRSENRAGIENALKMAQSKPPISEPGGTWDTDPLLLGCANGVLDLKTGTLRPGRPEDRITLETAVSFDPDARAPRWEKFITEVFDDPEVATFVQRALGYTITGSTGEQVLFLCIGQGSNGKSTLFDAVCAVLGDGYSRVAPFSIFEQARSEGGERATPDMARLKGARLVVAGETEKRSTFNEAKIKTLVGSGPIPIRRLYRESDTFEPRFKVWLHMNHRPRVTDRSHGFWRRLRLIEFRKQFAVNLKLGDELKAEGPGILAWLVKGCRAWQREGLNPPAAVLAAVDDYREETDTLSGFIAECQTGPNHSSSATEIYKAYQAWAGRQGISERSHDWLTIVKFADALLERGFKKERSSKSRIYKGIAPGRPLID